MDRFARVGYLRLFLVLVWMVAGAQLAVAQLTASPAQVAFGSAYPGIATPALSVTVSNTGSGPLYILYISGQPATGDFSIASSTCLVYAGTTPVPLASGANCTVSVQFKPTVVGPETGSLLLGYSNIPNPSATQIIPTLTVPLSGTGLFPATLSTTQLNFGNVVENPNISPSLPVTITNSGGIPLSLTVSYSNSMFASNPYLPGSCSSYLAVGGSCTLTVVFSPTMAGPQTGTAAVTATNYYNSGQVFKQATIALSGFGHPISVSPSLDFQLTLLGTSSQSFIYLFNASNAHVSVGRVTVSGTAFTAGTGCVGSLAPFSSCAIAVTFTPTVAAVATGTVTVYDDDPLSPQVIPLSGTATAMKLMGPDPSSLPAAFFSPQRLLATSASQNFTLTNTGSVPLSLQSISVEADYVRSTTCKSSLAAHANCTIGVSFEPIADGFRSGNLTIAAADPASPKQAPLTGTGIGIGNAKIRLHYDYMVASDHTHDPEATSPGAIERIVQTFAQHGVELEIDPHHTAIPEIPVITFWEWNPNVLCDSANVNFYTLRNQYFSPKSPGEHYTIFAHSYTSPDLNCFPSTSGGRAELPGLNFVVTLGNWPTTRPDLFSSIVAGTFMHELGHNLGLHHGGGFGGGDFSYCLFFAGWCYATDPVNYKPNYLSVMNYAFQFYGVPQADAVGSTTPKSCSADPDCGTGQSCLPYYSLGTVTKKACYRKDYSTQRLPTGGNTPGILDETNLDETAGLGSGTADISWFHGASSAPGMTIATTGPVDWDSDGAVDEQHLAGTVDYLWDILTRDFSLHQLRGWDDWKGMLGNVDDDASMAFSGARPAATSASGTQLGLTSASPTGAPREPELDFETAAAHHVLFPLRPAPVVVQPGCKAQSKPVPAGAPGTFLVALLATDDFDVKEVDLSSLQFHGARPVNTWFQDVNGDGVPDLVIQFLGAQVRLSKNATRAHLTGWLKNSQAFVGEEKVTIVPDALRAVAACQ